MVNAQGDWGGAGIGAGERGGPVTVSVTNKPLIFAGPRDGPLAASDGPNGRLIRDNVTIGFSEDFPFTVVVTAGIDFTVPSGGVLTVAPHVTLNLGGHTITNNGVIKNSGVINP